MSNPRKGVASFTTPSCSSYWKGSLRVTLDYGRASSTTTTTIYVYLYVCVCVSVCVYMCVAGSFAACPLSSAKRLQSHLVFVLKKKNSRLQLLVETVSVMGIHLSYNVHFRINTQEIGMNLFIFPAIDQIVLRLFFNKKGLALNNPRRLICH